MRILTDEFVGTWRGRMINVHPSLLPAFAGGMDKNVHKAVIEKGVSVTGMTIHQVTENVDGGEVILQRRCRVLPDDTEDSLKARVQALEGQGFVDVVREWQY